jgi:DNA-binding transcriptional ArsR family regulator
MPMMYPCLIVNTESAAALLDAPASDNRLHILRRLVGVEVSAGALAPEIGISQPALSQQLTKLRKLGLVRI